MATSETRPRAHSFGGVTHGRVAIAAASIASAVAGSLVPLQADINAELAAALDNPVASAAVSTILSGVLLSFASVRSCGALKLDGLKPWHLSGGVFGAVYVLALVVLTEPLGPATLFVAAEAGSMAVAAILDHVGFAGAATRRLTQRRAAGVLLPVLGCVVLEAPAVSAAAGASGAKRLRLAALSFAAGGCKPLQASLNRRLKMVMGSTEVAAVTSCAVGGCALVAMLMLDVTIRKATPAPDWVPIPDEWPAWWQWSGGLLGIVGVVVPVLASEVFGMAVYFVCNLFGQLSAAVALQFVSGREAVTQGLVARMCGAVVLGLLGGLLVQDLQLGACASAPDCMRRKGGARILV